MRRASVLGPALAVVLGIALAAPRHVSAEPAAASTAPAPAVTAPRRALAVAAAVIPGLIVRGAGSWVVRERPTARRLMYVELAGLALAAVGGLPIGLTGGAEESLPGLALAIPGAGLLVTSWLADLHVASGGVRIGGRPGRPAQVEAALGYTFVGDRHLPIEHLAAGAAEVRNGRARAHASGWLGDGAWRGRLAGGARLLGARPDALAADGTAIDVELAVAREVRTFADVAFTSGELGVAARLDLGRLAAPLAGSFTSAALGVGFERARYAAASAADTTSLFAGRFGWGVYLGDNVGEVELYYQHRRDTLAGGLTPPLAYNGFIGHVGLAASGWRGQWGLATGLEIGSAYVASLAARWRGAAR